jgi:hypothetical protein
MMACLLQKYVSWWEQPELPRRTRSMQREQIAATVRMAAATRGCSRHSPQAGETLGEARRLLLQMHEVIERPFDRAQIRMAGAGGSVRSAPGAASRDSSRSRTDPAVEHGG